MIDSHCHLNFNAFKDDTPQAVARAQAAGVNLIINVGSQFNTSQRAVELAEEYNNLYAAIGLHPIHLFEQEVDEEETHFTTRAEVFAPEKYRELAKSSAKVIAVGECGLDYYHFPKGIDIALAKKAQVKLFQQQIDVATKLNLPLIVHCRQAYDDLLTILQTAIKAGQLPKRGVVHCFLGNMSQAKLFLDLGFFISFTGIITFKNAKAELLAAVRSVPLDKILTETDAPYLAPQLYRGARNEPAYVVEVAKKIAEIKGLSYEEIDTATTENTRALFGIS